jgi:tetratricopeptide (TPR) repeat protein
MNACKHVNYGLTLKKVTAVAVALAAAFVTFARGATADGENPAAEPASAGPPERRMPAGSSGDTVAASTTADELKSARLAVAVDSNDANAHLRLADVLRKLGRNQEASQQYLAAASLKRDLYVAYHHLSVICADRELIDKAIQQLTEDKQKNPHELMLRVALSELLEKRKDYYQAAKPLIEIQYDNSVPAKYRPRVEARIHYLLSKAHEAQLNQPDTPGAADEELDVVPAPLPDASLRKGLTASKIKDSKELKGMGHVPLLP